LIARVLILITHAAVKPYNLVLALACVTLLWSTAASAQTSEPSSSISRILKAVGRDPVTYTPVVMKFTAMSLDWESSQIFFRHGFVEHNERYTVSGRPDDVPISHAAGRRKLAMDSLTLLARTVPQSLAERATERLLVRVFPQHKKAMVVAGRAIRILGASYMSYTTSRANIRRWQRNERLAHQMGFK